MQSIERYGVVALVFLAVTVAAVLMWERSGGSSTVAAADSETAEPVDSGPTVRANVRAQRDRPLRRAEMQESLTGRIPSSRPSIDELRGERGAGIAPARHESASTPPPGESAFPPPEEDTPQPVNEPSVASPEPEPERESPVRDERAETASAPDVYVVQEGDTLTDISMRELGTWKRYEEIVELNPGLDPRRLRVGTRLVLPADRVASSAPAAAPASTPSPPATPPAPSGSTYRVAEGDNLWKIAATTLGDGARWGDIAQANPGLDADRLKVGQVLRLPTGARVNGTPRASRPEPAVASATPERTSRGRRVK
jgi:nucleoid-associated protein YgaU